MFNDCNGYTNLISSFFIITPHFPACKFYKKIKVVNYKSKLSTEIYPDLEVLNMIDHVTEAVM